MQYIGSCVDIAGIQCCFWHGTFFSSNVGSVFVEQPQQVIRVLNNDEDSGTVTLGADCIRGTLLLSLQWASFAARASDIAALFLREAMAIVCWLLDRRQCEFRSGAAFWDFPPCSINFLQSSRCSVAIWAAGPKQCCFVSFHCRYQERITWMPHNIRRQT